MQRSQTVSESRVLCSLVGVQTKAKLLYATQPLKLWRVDQANHQPAFSAVVAQRDDVVNRIAINSLRQGLEPIPSGLGSAVYHKESYGPSGQRWGTGLVVTKPWPRTFTEFRTKTEFSDMLLATNWLKSKVFRLPAGRRTMAPPLLKGTSESNLWRERWGRVKHRLTKQWSQHRQRNRNNGGRQYQECQ